jgi:nitroreductase / dihydropteridine reductase
MDIVTAARKRSTAKAYDPTRQVPEDTMRKIYDVLRHSPSSVNSQPWRFIVASTPEGRARMAKGAQGTFAFNEPKITQASHVILFCARTDADAGFLDLLLAQEQRDGRFKDETARAAQSRARNLFLGLHRYQGKDVPQWLEKQVYIAFGTALLAASTLDVDTTPLEGIDTKALDAEFGLNEQGYTSLVMLSLGYRAETDFNAGLPKSRLKEEHVFTFV